MTGPGWAVVLGVGNPDAGDDGAGFEVERRVRERALPGVRTGTCRGDLTRLLDLWEGYALACIVDAVDAGAEPGRVFRWEMGATLPAEATRATSTHTLPLDQVLDLARGLGRLPPRLVVYGVQVGMVREGNVFSPAVWRALSKVVLLVLEDLRAGSPASSPAVLPGATHA